MKNEFLDACEKNANCVKYNKLETIVNKSKVDILDALKNEVDMHNNALPSKLTRSINKLTGKLNVVQNDLEALKETLSRNIIEVVNKFTIDSKTLVENLGESQENCLELTFSELKKQLNNVFKAALLISNCGSFSKECVTGEQVTKLVDETYEAIKEKILTGKNSKLITTIDTYQKTKVDTAITTAIENFWKDVTKAYKALRETLTTSKEEYNVLLRERAKQFKREQEMEIGEKLEELLEEISKVYDEKKKVVVETID